MHNDSSLHGRATAPRYNDTGVNQAIPVLASDETIAREHDSAPPCNLPETRDADAEDFGAVLRHELNNPLTGILGNAELLLAEIRRAEDNRFPRGGLQRLETIAALAVRMRETIRRISQEWGVQDAVLKKKT